MENQDNNKDEYIEALIKLHNGLERLGPGDDALSKFILSLLPALPENPMIVDIGCGTGAGTFILAAHFNTRILAQDFSKDFLEELKKRAADLDLGHLIQAEQSDMGNLKWEPGSIDLLWSEGAAYNLTFEGALKAWRPLMADDGIAVISELSYFTEDIPEPVSQYWKKAYPTIGTETENCVHAQNNGFEILGFHRLRSEAWWNNYYEPLKERMLQLGPSADTILESVMEETRLEMECFKEYSRIYGYTFYILGAV